MECGWCGRQVLECSIVPCEERVALMNASDECYSPDGEEYRYGRCDICGQPCDENGCAADPKHDVGPFTSIIK